MRWMRGAVLSVLILGLMPVSAEAGTIVLAPPGHPGANQYFETIPTSAGNAAPPGSVKGSGTANAGPSALSHFGRGRSGDARLTQLGKNGAAAAALAASTAPSGVSPATTGAARASTGNTTTGSSSPGGSIASGLSHALTSADSGGLGIALPLLLATAALAAICMIVALVRRPRTPARP